MPKIRQEQERGYENSGNFMKSRIFISSVQREFAKERKALAEYVRKDAILGRFFDVFLFEDTEELRRLMAEYSKAKKEKH